MSRFLAGPDWPEKIAWRTTLAFFFAGILVVINTPLWWLIFPDFVISTALYWGLGWWLDRVQARRLARQQAVVDAHFDAREGRLKRVPIQRPPTQGSNETASRDETR